MKKLQIISEKIEKTNNNYFGRGSFETIIKENKEEVLSWLENLLPVQEQIKILDEQFGCENLQKRNYVRILTKIFSKEYNQFVCVNILLRDIDSITLAFSKNNDLKVQYNLLIDNNRLKFPGKHQIYVDFETYQQFVILYTHDLINKSQDFETDEVLDENISLKNSETPNIQEDNFITDEPQKKIDEEEILAQNLKDEESFLDDTNNSTVEIIEEEVEEKKEIIESKKSKSSDKNEKDKTNWMNVLLKGI